MSLIRTAFWLAAVACAAQAIPVGARDSVEALRQELEGLKADYDARIRALEKRIGGLYKLTLAPQLAPHPSPLSRPSIRSFLTHAWWDQDFVGRVAPQSSAEDDLGLALGVQFEAWW